MKNQEIAKIFHEMAIYLEMDGVKFKPQAYEKAALTIETLTEDVEDSYKKGKNALDEIPGIGKGLAEKIEEYLKTGTIKEYQQLKRKIPVDVEGITAIEGIGPKIVKTLYKELHIKSVAELERAAKAGKIRNLPHFGEKKEQNILQGIEFVKRSTGRFLLGDILGYVQELEQKLKKIKGVERIAVAGSIRRRKETIGDVDLLVVAKKPQIVMDAFTNMPDVIKIWGKGSTKSSVRLKAGFDVDLRVVPEKSFGTALQYFTGSKEHNVVTRTIAIKRGLKLNEYGLFRGKKQIITKTEEAVYKALLLQYPEPELRENRGEVERAQQHKLPKLVAYDSLKGDLQTQTTWTDGANTIEEYAREALRIGREYIAITDHTKRLAMTGGLDEKKLRKQMAEINAVNEKLKIKNLKFRILKGSEVDILKDGSLDLPDSALKDLDVVGASVHSHFNLSREAQTARIIKAMENPHVDIIFHPTGRIINRRPPYEIDMDAIIAVAKRTKTVLEINAYPNRLDLRDEHIRKCVEKGVKMSIDSDAHNITHLTNLNYGIAQARRGWAKASDIINTLPLEKMLKSLK